ncbi:MAG: NUDIX hydrolase [Chloroflexaceae bacterium]|nr:NUDIX hydrolase [Chloroflexaceae bacterium]
MQPWKTLDRSLMLNQSKFLVVERHTVELPDGRVIEDWPWIITPDFVNIVVVTTSYQFVCFRQTKYAAEGVSLAPVGGYLEPGEDALIAGQRELLEETGYTANEWTYLGTYAVDGNRGAGRAHFYLAQGAERTTTPDADDLEEQEVVLLSRADVETALLAHEFKVLPWSAAMALALLVLDRQANQNQ